MDNLYIARQPVFDLNNAVIGYELLYRANVINRANIIDADQATCETILNSFMHIGIDNLVGSALAFINLPREFVVNESLMPMFRDQSVLELHESIRADKKVVSGVKRLKADGCRIALDDFVFSKSLAPLIELADFVKIDVRTLSTSELTRLVALLQPYDAKLVAEKVETAEAYRVCSDIGFDYFQGFFFSYPVVLTRKTLPSNKLVVLKLLSKLHDPDTESDELETILAQDIALSYKLLRYINSAAFALRREVDSIRDAIVLLGRDNLANWATLILMSKLIDSKPAELIKTGMIRGKMCELLAQSRHPEIKSQMFVIGLFSVLDALMDQPLIDLLDNVILATPIKLALLDQSGSQGDLYRQVLEYERCHWDELDRLNASADDYARSYINAVQWADQNLNALLRS